MFKKNQIFILTLLWNTILFAQSSNDTVAFHFESELRIRNGELFVQVIKCDSSAKVYYKLIDNTMCSKARAEAIANAEAECKKYNTDFYRKRLDSIANFDGNKDRYKWKVDSLVIPLSDFEKIKQQLKLVIKPYTNEQLSPKGSADGSLWSLKFWNDGEYYTYKVWSPKGSDKRRNLEDFVNVSYQIVNLTKLKSKKILE